MFFDLTLLSHHPIYIYVSEMANKSFSLNSLPFYHLLVKPDICSHTILDNIFWIAVLLCFLRAFEAIGYSNYNYIMG
jgi:hypothetical protein